jgi:hypothetical protein
METIWKKKFVWLPEYVEDGDPTKLGWRWLTFGWYRWFKGHYSDYWRPATHNWDDK